jgi:hypothetical protein
LLPLSPELEPLSDEPLKAFAIDDNIEPNMSQTPVPPLSDADSEVKLSASID